MGDRFDVVVVGGGAGGVAAAVAAARCGARTALVERYGFLGGAATNALVMSFCGFYVRDPEATQAEAAVGGLGREILDRLHGSGIAPTPVKTGLGNWVVFFQPESLKRVLDDIVAETGVDVRLHSFLVGAARDGVRLSAIDVADHDGTHRLSGAAFVDASGEADLCARAGVPMLAAAALGSPLQAASLPMRITGLPRAAIPDRTLLAAIVADLGENSGVATLRADGGTFYPIPGTSDLWWMGLDATTDGVSAQSLTAAERDARALAGRFLAALRVLPGCAGASFVASGPQIGIRESRRPRARRIVSGDDARTGRTAADGIARAAWPIEVHAAPGRPSMIPLGGPGWFHVPLPALEADGIENLWLAGRIIGCDREAHGSVRVMGTAFATGQAAGTAAALAVAGRRTASAVRSGLLAEGAIL